VGANAGGEEEHRGSFPGAGDTTVRPSENKREGESERRRTVGTGETLEARTAGTGETLEERTAGTGETLESRTAGTEETLEIHAVGAEETCDEEVVGEEAQNPNRHVARALHEPGMPSEQEKKMHELTHLPYKSWCAICRAARGYSRAHIHSDELCEVPILSADYFFMGEAESPGCIASLVIKDCRSKCIISFAVPKKGRDEYVVQRVLQALAFMGHREIIFKTDQEPAICALIEEVRDSWSGKLMHEKSPVADHRANGWIEAGVRTVEAQIRAIKMSFEDKYGIIMDHISPLVTWMIEYAGWLVTRFGVGRDNKTPYRLLRGREATSPLCEFGECVQYRPPGLTRARGKLQSMLSEGVYLGRTHSSGESLIGTPKGVVRARDVYRRTRSERFNVETLKSIVGVPWQMTPNREIDHEEIPEFRVASSDERSIGEHADQVGSQLPRRVKMTKDIMDKYGMTPQCPGCVRTSAPGEISSSASRVMSEGDRGPHEAGHRAEAPDPSRSG